MMTKSKAIEPADVRDMLNGALTDIGNMTRFIQCALEELQGLISAGSADIQAWVDKTLATLQQARGHQQRVEWEIDAASTYLRNILRQHTTSQAQPQA